MDGPEDWNRAKWASRRGLLELDLLLSPFVNEAFPNLSADLRSCYLQLLCYDDQDLILWILGRAVISEENCESIVLEIRRFHGITNSDC